MDAFSAQAHSQAKQHQHECIYIYLYHICISFRKAFITDARNNTAFTFSHIRLNGVSINYSVPAAAYVVVRSRTSVYRAVRL